MEVSVAILLVLCGMAASQNCDSDEIQCGDGRGCVSRGYICDYDDDCDDGSDEDYELCEVVRNDDCPTRQFKCDGDSSCISTEEYCMMDPPCDGNLDRRYCMMMESGQLDSLDNFESPKMMMMETDNLNKSEEMAEKFRNLIPSTLYHEQCPQLYTLVGDVCISIFHIGSMSWAEARDFCRGLSGDLATFMDVGKFAEVVQHLQQYELTSDFWIGGSIENESEGWTWVDGSPMDLGSPFWATKYSDTCLERNVTMSGSEDMCFRYYQAPEAETMGQCVSLCYEHFFFMNDMNCLEKKSPLCMYTGENASSGVPSLS